MYLHLGNDVVVNINDIVGIFDMDNTTVSHQTRGFLTKAQRENSVIDVTDDLPKSFIVTADERGTRVYISSLASQTLWKRAKSNKLIN